MALHAKSRFGRLRSIISKVGRVGLTLAFVALAAVLVQLGATTLESRANATPSPEAASLTPVSTRTVQYTDTFNVTRAYTGQVEPQRTVALSFENAGRLVDVLADEGDMVTEGQEIARLDTAVLKTAIMRLDAARDATSAQLRFANQTVTRSRGLTSNGFTSQATLDEALARQDELQARLEEIAAQREEVTVLLEKSRIYAPFDGQITKRSVDAGETLSAGQQVVGIVEQNAPIVRVGIPQNVTEAQLQDSKLIVNGVAHTARLHALRPDVDPVTRTRTALFELPESATTLFGQTVTVTVVQQITARGLWLPVTSLTEGVNGQWMVLVVDPQDVVRHAPVEVLHAESEQVYVRAAMPEGTRLIDAGPHRVTTGQRVVAQAANQ